ncbi:MAG TPA: hypothetical protein VN445_14070 [Rectinemataceae bacterium]|nr:hypothetical protein [Rectinemataceae bacterium]
MNKIRYALARFMAGRYGVDELYRASNVLCLVLIVAGAFFMSPILNMVLWMLMLWSIFRSFSKNIEKRRRENEKYLSLTKPLRKRFSRLERRIKNVKAFRFRTCPRCKAFIQMPRAKGKRLINCPRCHNEFEARVIL